MRRCATREHTENWKNYPLIEECTDMGDTNGNKLDVEIGEIEDRVIALGEQKEKIHDFCQQSPFML